MSHNVHRYSNLLETSSVTDAKQSAERIALADATIMDLRQERDKLALEVRQLQSNLSRVSARSVASSTREWMARAERAEAAVAALEGELEGAKSARGPGPWRGAGVADVQRLVGLTSVLKSELSKAEAELDEALRIIDAQWWQIRVTDAKYADVRWRLSSTAAMLRTYEEQITAPVPSRGGTMRQEFDVRFVSLREELQEHITTIRHQAKDFEAQVELLRAAAAERRSLLTGRAGVVRIRSAMARRTLFAWLFCAEEALDVVLAFGAWASLARRVRRGAARAELPRTEGLHSAGDAL